MARWTIGFIAACWLLAVSPGDSARAAGVDRSGASERCASCHRSASGVLAGPMATRQAERAFARRAFGAEGESFFASSCTGCHVSSCNDCHATQAAAGRKRAALVRKPTSEACLRCHRGYFVGWDYFGRAPREDHARYQRGPDSAGEHYLPMLADVHAERGMGCADCHTMASLHQQKAAAPSCRGCHPAPSNDVPEHAVAAHLEKMTCQACHSAWATQEYGTFLVSPRTGEEEEFAPLRRWGNWRKSAYLKRQDAPPLGLDARGKVAPIRPQFILAVTDARRGFENRLLAAEWKAFSPHTIRRGSVTCGGCHEDERRFLLEPEADRIYFLEKDGLMLRSFWAQEGQRIVNGGFFSRDRFDRMNRNTPQYIREHLRQWKRILGRDDPRSAR